MIEVDMYIPVYRYKKSGRKVPLYAMPQETKRLMVNSRFSYVGVDNLQDALIHKANISATHGGLVPGGLELSHFEHSVQEIPDDEIDSMWLLDFRVSDHEEDGYNYTYPLLIKNSLCETLLYLNYNASWLSVMDDSTAFIFTDMMTIHECNSAMVSGNTNWRINQNRLEYLNCVYRGHDTPYSIADYDIVYKKKRKNKPVHYVYTLSHPQTGNAIYVGYTTDPESRYQAHVCAQTNSYLAEEILNMDGLPKMDIIYKTKSMRDALDYETDMIVEFGRYFTLANIAKNPYRI
jgi:predicted GIY-YIG superfamily endonuclease